jgi:hypothetical protein
MRVSRLQAKESRPALFAAEAAPGRPPGADAARQCGDVKTALEYRISRDPGMPDPWLDDFPAEKTGRKAKDPLSAMIGTILTRAAHDSQYARRVLETVRESMPQRPANAESGELVQ